MSKLSAVIATAFAFLAVPALAAAAPSASQITTPSNPAFVQIDNDVPKSLHVEGTTSGGDGAVDIRCYYGATSAALAAGVPVTNGAFQTDIPLGAQALSALGYPRPYCTLRAVPTTSAPPAPPNAPSEWQGPEVGWGELDHYDAGAGVYDYLVGQAQSGAFNDYYSAGSCGLCDTYLFAPGTKARSNGIWWANSGLYTPRGFDNRTAVTVDGVKAYTAGDVYYNPLAQNLADNPGAPAVSETHAIDPLTGDLTIDEHSAYKTCAPEPATYPPSDVTCATFADSGVVLDRHIRQTAGGLRVTITDHWKSTDGMPHELDAVYEDSVHSENAKTAGHEGRVNFTWTQAGFTSYDTKTQVPLPDSAPATALVKTDRATPDAGDNVNPFGAVTFGARPDELLVVSLGNVAGSNGHWDARYARSIPAGGEVVISVAYSAGFSLDAVKAMAEQAEAELAPPPAPVVDPAPADPASTPQSQPQPPASNLTPPAPLPAPVRCVVPKLKGKTLAKAKRLLARAHCRLGKVSRRASKVVKPGRIVTTRLKPGTKRPAGASVRVTVARR